MSQNALTESGKESRARRAAKRVGLLARKTRWRRGTVDNHGGFAIIDPIRNTVVSGVRFNLSADDVLNFCNQDG